jgi:ribonuclease VapC
VRLVLDTSALVAILLSEDDADRLLDSLKAAEERLVSAVSAYEFLVVMLRRQGPDGLRDAAELLDALALRVIPFDEPTALASAEAYARFGKGIDPRARLNLGDCAAYATARALDAALLFKGADFAQTDIRAGLAPPA